MKKILLIIYMSLVPLYSVFGQTQIGVSIHDTTVVAGESVYIPVYIDSSLTGQNVTSFNFEFSFSDYYVTIDSVITDGTLSGGWGSVVFNLSGNERFSVAGASSDVLVGTGTLFYLKVKLIRSGGTYISFASDGNNYFNEGTPGVILDNGYLNIGYPPTIKVTPDMGVLLVGDTEDFNVSGGTSPYTWSVSNPSVAAVNSDGLVTALNKGTTKIICEDSSGMADTTDGVLEVRAFKLSMRDTSFYQGNLVDIPIYTTDLTGLNYTAGQIDINVDADYLTPIQIVTTGTILENCSTPQFSVNGDKLSIAFAGDTPLSGSGILMIVRYRISAVNTYGTTLSFTNILFNETDLGLGDNAYFDVLPLPTINISPSTATLLAGEVQVFTASSGTPPYTWSVSNPALASIGTDGTLTAIKGGVVTVSVQDTYGGSGNSGDVYIYDTEVSIPDTTVDIGSSIDIPLYMGNINSAYSIVSVQAEVSFDSSKIHFDELITSGTLSNGWSFSINNSGSKIVFAGAGSSGFNSSGTVLKLRFSSSPDVTNGSYSNLTISGWLFNEGSPNALLNNGRITISNVHPPSPPSSLIATAISNNGINLSWADNSANENGFKIERTEDTTSTWTQIATVAANNTSYSNTGLTDGTQYYYRVLAYNDNGNSGYSNIAGAFTVLSAPTDLTGVLAGSNSLDLSWADNSSAETGYIIERKEYTTSFSVLDTVSANVTSYHDSGLTVGEDYTYRVMAFNNLTVSDYSNYFEILVTNQLPNPPSDLVVTTRDSSSIGLYWTDNSIDETGFIVERKIGTAGSWAQIDSLSMNSVDYTDNGLVDGTLYFYRVNAFNDAGNSGYSNEDSAVTTMNPPRGLVATNSQPGKVQLTWTDFSESEEGFIIERAEGHIGESLLFTVIDTALANNTYYLDSNLTSAESYVYRIRAYNEYTESVYSNMAPVTLVGISEGSEVPTQYQVFQNYPNPFSKNSGGNSATTLKFSLPERTNVHIKVYNMLGCEIANLMSGELNAGYHKIVWQAGDIPSGVYIISFNFEGANNRQVHSFIKKAILLK